MDDIFEKLKEQLLEENIIASLFNVSNVELPQRLIDEVVRQGLQRRPDVNALIKIAIEEHLVDASSEIVQATLQPDRYKHKLSDAETKNLLIGIRKYEEFLVKNTNSLYQKITNFSVSSGESATLHSMLFSIDFAIKQDKMLLATIKSNYQNCKQQRELYRALVSTKYDEIDKLSTSLMHKLFKIHKIRIEILNDEIQHYLIEEKNCLKELKSLKTTYDNLLNSSKSKQRMYGILAKSVKTMKATKAVKGIIGGILNE